MAYIEFRGMREFRARIARFVQALDPAAKDSVLKIAGLIVGTAKERVRVETGSLQRDIRVEPIEVDGQLIQVRVVAGGSVTNPRTGRVVDYAVQQEFGTSRMLGQPYMGPAFQEHGPKLVKALEEGVRE